jgi:hypothetical protein
MNFEKVTKASWELSLEIHLQNLHIFVNLAAKSSKTIPSNAARRKRLELRTEHVEESHLWPTLKRLRTHKTIKVGETK